ncbi:hypothetical protein INR49_015681 [Caranx melampygus]|nr:hypothetical protein INR49_015681 [Caranx melampygus]
MTPQVVAVTEGLVAVATDERRLAFVFLLYHRHWRPTTSSAGHIIFQEISSAGRWLLFYLDGQDRLLVNLFSSCIKQWQQAVLGHLVLVQISNMASKCKEMGDWSILGRFLTEVQNHSTVIGKIWLTMLLIFRILLVTLVGDAVYSDEQSKFTCNTLQPGCNNVCYDTFAPVSHLRFWVFQIVLVSTPSIFYIVYVLQKITKNDKVEVKKIEVIPQSSPALERDTHLEGEKELSSSYSTTYNNEDWSSQEGECEEKSQLEEEMREVGKDPTQLSSQVLLIYIIHVLLRSIMEIIFLIGQYYLFGFEVPHLFRCETYPCPNRTDCFVSRATEKTIFLNFMFSVSLDDITGPYLLFILGGAFMI